MEYVIAPDPWLDFILVVYVWILLSVGLSQLEKFLSYRPIKKRSFPSSHLGEGDRLLTGEERFESSGGSIESYSYK